MLKLNPYIIVAVSAVLLAIAVFSYLIISNKLIKKTLLPMPPEMPKDVIESLTAPSGNVEVSEEIIKSLTAPAKGKISEEIIISLTAPQ